MNRFVLKNSETRFQKAETCFKKLKLVSKMLSFSKRQNCLVPHKKSIIGHVRIGKLRFKSTMFLRTIVVVGMQCSGAPSGWWLRRRGSSRVVAGEWGGWCWGMTPSSPAAPTSGTATTRRQWGSRSCCCGRCCRRRWRWPMTRWSTGLVVIRGHHILALKTQ